MTPLHLGEDERTYLTYVARRIDHEVGLLLRENQDLLTTVQHVELLAGLAQEILGEDELRAWLDAATRVLEIPQDLRL